MTRKDELHLRRGDGRSSTPPPKQQINVDGYIFRFGARTHGNDVQQRLEHESEFCFSSRPAKNFDERGHQAPGTKRRAGGGPGSEPGPPIEVDLGFTSGWGRDPGSTPPPKFQIVNFRFVGVGQNRKFTAPANIWKLHMFRRGVDAQDTAGAAQLDGQPPARPRSILVTWKSKILKFGDGFPFKGE